MKFLLIFWLANTQPQIATMNSSFACAQGLNVLKGSIPSLQGVCLPTIGDEGSYHRLFTDANPEVPN